jgi:hypothetical protein
MPCQVFGIYTWTNMYLDILLNLVSFKYKLNWIPCITVLEMIIWHRDLVEQVQEKNYLENPCVEINLIKWIFK